MSIKNADLPAMPIPLFNGDTFHEHGPADGLTKLEYAAIEMMKKLSSRDYARFDYMAEDAIGEAEALFRALEQRP